MKDKFEIQLFKTEKQFNEGNAEAIEYGYSKKDASKMADIYVMIREYKVSVVRSKDGNYQEIRKAGNKLYDIYYFESEQDFKEGKADLIDAGYPDKHYTLVLAKAVVEGGEYTICAVRANDGSYEKTFQRKTIVLEC